LVVVVAVLGLASPAQAFDAGPHTDMTRDALTAEGFGGTAADVGVVDNWFVDYYWNAKKNPFSGHADVKRTLLALIQIFAIEFWPQDAIDGTNHLHFDSSEEGFPDLSTTKGVDDEWQRLLKVTRNQLQKARADQDPLAVMTVIGASLHGVQDFYAHTNWVETTGEFNSVLGPGWDPAKYGSNPTYFDVPKTDRDNVPLFSAVTGIDRGHGGWASKDLSAVKENEEGGANKDWPGRPLYEKAYVTSYFASRQWIRAAKGWLGDDALWSRTQRLGSPRALKSDLTASHDISQYSGHWQGSGEPCDPSFSGCGGRYGWAGSIFSLRSALKTYHENYTDALRASAARLKFESIAPAYYGQPGGDPVPEPASSADIQRQTRFVELAVIRQRGFDFALGDPGPDDADLYTSARIRNQQFLSTVFHDHDKFTFATTDDPQPNKPYAPTTWIRSVPVGWRASTPISNITVRVSTGDRRWAGTDDDVYVRFGDGNRYSLEKRAYNDFERGDNDTYALALDGARKRELSLEDLKNVQIQKSPDRLAGGWFLSHVQVKVNGSSIVNTKVNRWLEDDQRVATFNIARDHRTKDIVPVAARLNESDLVYGGDDTGDVNRLDRNTSVTVGYVPGPTEFHLFTGGKELSGRLSMQNGERGQFRLRLSTIIPTVPVAPTPTPTPTPAPTVTTTPTTQPTPTATATPKPDLIIGNVDVGFTPPAKVTVTNQGQGPAGAFSVSLTSQASQNVSGLAAGASTTLNFTSLCNTPGSTVVTADAGSQVSETNEANNTKTLTQSDKVCVSRRGLFALARARAGR
jgi:hypothetical protein